MAGHDSAGANGRKWAQTDHLATIISQISALSPTQERPGCNHRSSWSSMGRPLCLIVNRPGDIILGSTRVQRSTFIQSLAKACKAVNRSGMARGKHLCFDMRSFRPIHFPPSSQARRRFHSSLTETRCPADCMWIGLW